MNNTFSRLVFAGLVATTGACSVFKARGPKPPPTYITFNNQSIDQADVYATSPGTGLVRIGTVAGGRSELLTLSPSLVSGGRTLNFVARRLATTRIIQTGDVPITPGDSYEITLPSSGNTLTVLPGRPR